MEAARGPGGRWAAPSSANMALGTQTAAGRARTVKMEALRAIFAALGFREVETFIASGNVIFTSFERTLKVRAIFRGVTAVEKTQRKISSCRKKRSTRRWCM